MESNRSAGRQPQPCVSLRGRIATLKRQTPPAHRRLLHFPHHDHTKRGPLFLGRCPLNLPQHRGRERMFIVSPKHRKFYCFGCGRDGRVISLVMMAGRLKFGDAVRYLETNFLSCRCLLQTLSIPEREGNSIPSYSNSCRNPS